MAKNYEIKASVDMSQHNAAFKQGSLSVYKYEKQVNAAKRELNQFNKGVSSTVGGLGSLSSAFKSGNIMGFTSALQGLVPALGSVATGAGSMGAALTTALGPVGLLTAAIAAIGGVCVTAIKGVSEFETHLDALQSLTGLDDEAMKTVADGAIEMSKRVKGSASEIVDAMKLIGSQSPQLLSNSDALMKVTESANILAAAAKIEVVDAAKAITTVINQMGVDASKSSEIINTLAAASQKGAGDVAYLNVAFEKSGTAAASAKITYTELAALIETLAPKFSSADVAGAQLASTLLKLSVNGKNEFKPAVVGMQKALDNLAQAQLSDAELKKLVGERNITLIKTLIQAKDQYTQFSQTLGGTNTAFEQAKINGDNLDGAINRLKSSWDAFILTLGESGYLQSVLHGFESMLKFVQDIINNVQNLTKQFQGLGDTKDSVNLLVVEMQALGKVCDAVFEVINVGVALVKTNWEIAAGFMRKLWREIKVELGDVSWINAIINGLKKVIDWFRKLVSDIKKQWNNLKQALGIEVKEGGGTHVDGKTFRNRISGGTTNNDIVADTTTGGKTTIGKHGTGGKSNTNVPKYQVGSIAEYDSKIKDINDKLKNQKLTTDQINALIAQRNDLEQERAKLMKQQEIIAKTTTEEYQKQLKDALQLGKLDTSPLQAGKVGGVGHIQTPQQRVNNALGDLQKQYNDGIISVDAFKNKWAAIQAVAKDMGLTVDVTPRFKKEDLKNSFAGVSSMVDTISQAFNNLGQAIGGTGGQIVQFVGQAMSSIAQLIPQIATLIGAKEAEAVAGGTASAASLSFPYNLAAIAAVVATITSIFAGLASFADGGIIQGNSRIGDYNIARVNSGEMILNTGQQGRLWNAINNNRFGGDGSSTLVTGDVRIKGSDLYLALKNYNKLSGKRL